jgi:competence protein ComEA
MQMPQISRRRALAYVAALAAVLALGGRYALADDAAAPRAAPARASLSPAPVETRSLVVHVVGAVRRRGLYELPEGSRIHDALQKAGGPKPKAALELVNLAAPVADGQQVVVPVRAAPGMPAAPAAEAAGIPGGRLHLNSATLEQLDALPGIGPVTAQNILEYREQHGVFQSVEELDAVSGIGPARLEQLIPLVDL